MAVFRKYLSRIKYDNTNSGLTATNIPDAIDELSTKITTVTSMSTIINSIPAPPSADGEYNLHCSIVNGVPTYTWKAEQQ